MTSWLALLSDSPLNCKSSSKPYRLYRNFLAYVKLNGFKETVLQFSSLSHKLVSQHKLMGQSSLIGDWINDFKDTPVFFEYNHYFKTGDINVLRFIYTFLNFGKKLEYVDEKMNETAFRSWIDIENRLADQSFLNIDISSLKKILSTVLPTFSIDSFFPKFGNGSVSERGVYGRNQKIENFDYDEMIDRFIYHGHIGKYGYGNESGLSRESSIPIDDWSRTDRRASSRIARLMFVPKDLKTSRSICMEPNVLQYFQQGIMKVMLEKVDISVYAKFINLGDQNRNRSLAQYGSFSTLIDTIDLSSASDCLSLDLVKKIFPPSWLIPMIATRSHSCILPSGDIHLLKKFAPMGSALCFPTQCILFTTVGVYAACLFTYDMSGSTLPFEDWLDSNRIMKVIRSFGITPEYDLRSDHYLPMAVYGDDICVDSRLTHIVMSILDRLGFIVNRQKSFMGSQVFRESCGGFYLNDADITPILYRVKGVRRILSSSHLASAISLTNYAYRYGYRNLYHHNVHKLLYWNSRFRSSTGNKNAILFIEPNSDDFGIYSQNPLNTHLSVRDHIDYQRLERRCISITYHSKESLKHTSFNDKYEYMRWMDNHRAGISSDKLLSHLPYDTRGSRAIWRWTPVAV